jgi:hypothetical protein
MARLPSIECASAHFRNRLFLDNIRWTRNILRLCIPEGKREADRACIGLYFLVRRLVHSTVGYCISGNLIFLFYQSLWCEITAMKTARFLIVIVVLLITSSGKMKINKIG